jgi:chromosome segregation ATPase
MNQTPEPNREWPETGQQMPADAMVSPVNPSLGAAVTQDYEAVQSDLRSANELAASLESQLAGKSKEVLHLRFLFDQTKTHLAHMQDGIVAMRKERHKLANEAMRAMGLDLMLKRVTAERDRLKVELEGVLEGIAAEKTSQPLRFDKRDHQIAELTFELVKLRAEVAELRKANAAATPLAPPQASQEKPARPLKTAAEDEVWEAHELEIIPTERVPGGRAKA